MNEAPILALSDREFLYERLPFVQVFACSNIDSMVAALYPAFNAARLSAAGSYEFRWPVPYSMCRLEALEIHQV
jgi:hypothetical protein